MKIAGRLVTLGFVGAVAATSVFGASIDRWGASTEREFLLGTFEGTALDEHGGIALAPRLTHLWGPESGIVWDLAAGARGTVFVALSGPGQVVAIDADGDSTVWYDVGGDSLITALAPDGNGGVYAGLSPDGHILHLSGPGQFASVAETGAKFVWALASDDRGGLWVGTGIPGTVQRFHPDSGLETLHETGDDPVRSLLALDDGVAAGTGGRGRVLRVSAERRAFVLFDANETEIVALAGAPDGTIFALAAGGPRQPSPTAQAALRAADAYVRVRAEPPPSKTGNGKDAQADSKKKSPRPPGNSRATSGGGAIYRIDPGGVEAIWKASNEVPFDLVRAPDGWLFAATGDRGRVWRVTPDGSSSRVFRIASNQASALALNEAGQVWIGGTSDARVERLDTRVTESGEYRSFPIDAGTHATWGRIVWDAELPAGAAIDVAVRGGNTTEPDETWSDWVSLGADGQIDPDRVPRCRLIQIRLSLSAGGDRGPRVSALWASFEPRNRAPVISALSIEAPGVVIVPGPKPANGGLGPLIASDPVTRDALSRVTRGRKRGPTRRGYESGVRTFSWLVADPDGDPLTSRLDVQLEGESHWFPLAADLSDSYFSWDARATPDGHYRVRLTVSDAADNVEGDGLVRSRTSEVFRVDNSRPSVSDWSVERRGGRSHVAFTAIDPGGAVAAVEVAMGDGEWRPLRPIDGVADSEEERFRLVLNVEDGQEPPPSLRIRVTDSAGNLGGEMRRVERP